MKNKMPFARTILMTTVAIACHGTVKEANTNGAVASAVSTGQKYLIDTKESAVAWKGSNSVGTNVHHGLVEISSGALLVENGQLTGGKAEVDMNTIADETLSRDSGLVKHLKDPDFFDVKLFPVATFVLAKVASGTGGNKTVSGFLTIKGITNPVTFPAKIEMKNETVLMEGKLEIDRTKWDVRYQSGKFYNLLADQAISDAIEFDLKIVAKKE